MSQKTSQGFAGAERRRHRMFVTKNTEYHFRDGVSGYLSGAWHCGSIRSAMQA